MIETPYELQNKVNDAANDSWPDLTRAVSGDVTSSSNAVGGCETAKQKIARLKQIAERNGMSVGTCISSLYIF